MIDINDEFSLDGDVMIDLPPYMSSISQEKIEEIFYEGLQDRIISCGLHKPSGNFIILDGQRNLLELNPASFFSHKFEVLSVKPIFDGTKIEVTLKQFVIEADSKDILDASSVITISDFEIDM